MAKSRIVITAKTMIMIRELAPTKPHPSSDRGGEDNKASRVTLTTK